MEGIPNFTGASQGTGPNRTFETIFEGVGQAVGNAIDMKDKQNLAAIEREASSGFDELNKEFGLDIPAGVTDFAEKAKAVQAAFEQGKISQVNYYGRMAAMAKAVRQRYPGYESEVDRAIQAATGTRPANAYRDAILDEINRAQAEASSEEKFQRQWIKDNEAELSILYGDDFFQNPDKYPNAQADVARWKGQIETQKAIQQELATQAKMGEVNVVQATKAANTEAGIIVSSSINRALGVNNPDFTKTVNELIAAGGGTPEQQNQFIQQVTGAEHELRAQLYTQLRARYGSMLPADTLNKIIEDSLYPVLSLKEAVLGKDFKLAGRLAHVNKAMQDQQMNELLKDPAILAGAGLQEISQTLGDNYFNQSITDFNTVALDAAGRVLAGQKGTVAKVIDQGNGKVNRELLNQSFKMLVDPNLTDDKFSALFDEFFGSDGSQKNFMDSKVVAQEDLSKIYSLFLSPQMTQAVISKGSAEDLQKYTAWALEKATAIPELRTAASDINNASKHFDLLNPFINPKTGTIEFNESAGLRPGDPALQAGGIAMKGVNDINKVLILLKPIWEANGIDPVEGATKFISQLNTQLGGTFYEKLNETIQGGSGTDNIEGSTGPSERPDLLEDVNTDEIDFVNEVVKQEFETKGRRTTPSTVADPQTRDILDLIGHAEGAGYDTIFGHTERKYGVVPTQMTLREVLDTQKKMGRELGSSAFGKYQIIRKTMLGLIDKMDLSLDEVFTPELQDAMAIELLKGRGFEDWKAGKLGGRQFLNNLAKEWASVPNATGKSFYHGDRMGNKATAGGKKLASMFA